VSDVTLRDATAADLPVILGYVRALAAYERLEHLVTAGEEHFRAAMFGPSPLVFGVIAEIADRPVGFALWYRTFSTFTGTPSLYVEDVFVEEDHRDRGIGRALFRHLARTAVAQGCARMEWAHSRTNRSNTSWPINPSTWSSSAAALAAMSRRSAPLSSA
jgi:GNAT superfamily N-acetyltransferase